MDITFHLSMTDYDRICSSKSNIGFIYFSKSETIIDGKENEIIHSSSSAAAASSSASEILTSLASITLADDLVTVENTLFKRSDFAAILFDGKEKVIISESILNNLTVIGSFMLVKSQLVGTAMMAKKKRITEEDLDDAAKYYFKFLRDGNKLLKNTVMLLTVGLGDSSVSDTDSANKVYSEASTMIKLHIEGGDGSKYLTSPKWKLNAVVDESSKSQSSCSYISGIKFFLLSLPSSKNTKSIEMQKQNEIKNEIKEENGHLITSIVIDSNQETHDKISEAFSRLNWKKINLVASIPERIYQQIREQALADPEAGGDLIGRWNNEDHNGSLKVSRSRKSHSVIDESIFDPSKNIVGFWLNNKSSIEKLDTTAIFNKVQSMESFSEVAVHVCFVTAISSIMIHGHENLQCDIHAYWLIKHNQE